MSFNPDPQKKAIKLLVSMKQMEINLPDIRSNGNQMEINQSEFPRLMTSAKKLNSVQNIFHSILDLKSS